MTKPLRTWFVSLAIGLAAAALVLGLAWLNPAAASRLQISAADFVFLDSEGPGLGRIAPHPDIALVLFALACMPAIAVIVRAQARRKRPSDVGAPS